MQLHEAVVSICVQFTNMTESAYYWNPYLNVIKLRTAFSHFDFEISPILTMFNERI